MLAPGPMRSLPEGTTATNNGIYSLDGAGSYTTGAAETLTFQNGQGTATVILGASESAQTAITKINTATASLGIYAVLNSAGTGIPFQSINNFTASTTLAGGVFTIPGLRQAPRRPPLPRRRRKCGGRHSAINQAIVQLGNIQSRVGAGENILQYATSLANSQITNDRLPNPAFAMPTCRRSRQSEQSASAATILDCGYGAGQCRPPGAAETPAVIVCAGPPGPSVRD